MWVAAVSVDIMNSCQVRLYYMQGYQWEKVLKKNGHHWHKFSAETDKVGVKMGDFAFAFALVLLTLDLIFRESITMHKR